MNDWPHKLFSGGDLSDYLIDRWQAFSKDRNSASFDESKHLLHVPELNLSKFTIANWTESTPLPVDFHSYLDFMETQIDRLEAILQNRQKTFIVVDIPFEGDGNLFRFRPTSCRLQVPQGLLCDNTVRMRFERCGSNVVAWKNLVTDEMITVDAFLEAVQIPVQGFNEKVIASVRR
jgi:hypothetical protein